MNSHSLLKDKRDATFVESNYQSPRSLLSLANVKSAHSRTLHSCFQHDSFATAVLKETVMTYKE